MTINDKKEMIMQFDNTSFFNLSYMKLITQPNTTVKIFFKSPAILNFSVPDYSLNFTINLRVCKIGELQDSIGMCVPCSRSYSYNITDKFCKSCLKGLTCNDFGETTVNPGYWINHAYSEDIIKCENEELWQTLQKRF